MQHDNATAHYVALDAFRGIAALMVVFYHLFEAVAFAAGRAEQDMYHGYLAVDFFFILSGFVMGYAYDGRWGRADARGRVFGVKEFVRRRLIRLHPMVVFGVVFGVAVYLFHGSVQWDGTVVPWGKIVVAMLFALILLPCPLPFDVRGNTEAFPLNGPHWSLFFEYIGSLLYCFAFRRMRTRWLTLWVLLAAVALGLNTWLNVDGFACGWSSRPTNLLGGFLRMSFAYPMGLLLSRLSRMADAGSKNISAIFAVCALLFCALLTMPSVGAWNVAYELACVVVLFPLIVWLVASRSGVLSDGIKTTLGTRLMQWFGRLSYPLYAVHYPFIYMYIAWINKGVQPFGSEPWCTPVALFLIIVLVGAVVARFYDAPVRRWLNKRS